MNYFKKELDNTIDGPLKITIVGDMVTIKK